VHKVFVPITVLLVTKVTALTGTVASLQRLQTERELVRVWRGRVVWVGGVMVLGFVRRGGGMPFRRSPVIAGLLVVGETPWLSDTVLLRYPQCVLLFQNATALVLSTLDLSLLY